MNEDPRMILSARRPGGDDDAEPEVAAALEAAKSDAALAEWSEKQTAVDTTISRSLRAVQPPAGLRDRILAGARVSRPAGSGAESWFERRAFGFVRNSELVAILRCFCSSLWRWPTIDLGKESTTAHGSNLHRRKRRRFNLVRFRLIIRIGRFRARLAGCKSARAQPRSRSRQG